MFSDHLNAVVLKALAFVCNQRCILDSDFPMEAESPLKTLSHRGEGFRDTVCSASWRKRLRDRESQCLQESSGVCDIGVPGPDHGTFCSNSTGISKKRFWGSLGDRQGSFEMPGTRL